MLSSVGKSQTVILGTDEITRVYIILLFLIWKSYMLRSVIDEAIYFYYSGILL